MPDHVRWHRVAEQLLGLDPSPTPLPDYITSFVPWRRQNAVALLDFLDRRFSRSWMRTIASAWDFSEYVLYGRFVSDVLGEEGAQFATPWSLCRDYWEREPLTEAEVDALVESMSADQVAISITAKAGMTPTSYASVLGRHWAAERPSSNHAIHGPDPR